MKRPSQHIEWLSLIEVSGPFLAVGLLEKAFPQGLEAVETPRRQKLRAAYDEWCEAVDEDDAQLLALHREWVQLVLADILEYSQEVLFENSASEEPLEYRDPEHGVAFAPSLVVRSDGDTKPRLLISVYPPGTDLEKVKTNDGWPVSLMERMVLLCRSTGVRLGLLTNGDRWMLVNAPVGATSSHASWYARLWFQEPLTLKAFQSLLGVRRFFGPKDETLDSLLEKSLEYQEEVTDTLGAQVRRAVEVLVQCLDKADQDRNRELLRDVSPSELYEAGLTVMMRLVFVLCAEERGLLLLGDPVYDQCYAVSTLRGHLGEDADRHGPEVLERRHDAWTRLLSVFRAVYGGIEHESLRLPAMGGSLFDPDRFPFLEGRLKGTRWRETPAAPLPIDNRTVLLLLEALQVLEQPGGALLLSYLALDVEQIGHVYEGLLEHTVARAPQITVGLAGSKKAKNPNLTLADLESARMDGEAALLTILLEATQRSEPALRRELHRESDGEDFGRLLLVCGGDMDLAERIRPYASLLRTDAWGDPIVYRDGSFMVTLGAHRRETGTHYTPKCLTENIVVATLEPVAYAGSAEGLPRHQWQLKSPRELLNLRICDPAMGSGAFLVQACRWLGERVVEAWVYTEAAGKVITDNGDVLEDLGDADPMPSQVEDRLIIARRLVAERCLYGADINPLAVELAKLSIWLVTLAKGRPFGFLDHNLRSGDSLLGICNLDQITQLRMNPAATHHQLSVFAQHVDEAVTEAIRLRMRLRTTIVHDIRDVERMAHLNHEAKKFLEPVELVADAIIGEALRSEGNQRRLNSSLETIALLASDILHGSDNELSKRKMMAMNAVHLSVESVDGGSQRRPLHWVIEFPEVFLREQGGFDALIGNPPYINAVDMYTGPFSELKKKYYSTQYMSASGSYDLYVLFYERAIHLSANISAIGLLIPNKVLSAEYAESLRGMLVKHLRLHALLDYSTANAFSASVYPIACITTRPISEATARIVDSRGKEISITTQAALRNSPKFLWAYLLTEYAELLSIAIDDAVNLSEFFEVSGAATVSEAYTISAFVNSNDTVTIPKGHAKFIVSGNIRAFSTTWAHSPVQYLKHRYSMPSIHLDALPSKRRVQSTTPKVIISGLSKRPTAFHDTIGEYCAGKSTVLVLKPKGSITLETITQVLNSRIAALLYLGLYGGLALSGGYLRFGPPQISGFPLPRALSLGQHETIDEAAITRLYGLELSKVADVFDRIIGESPFEQARALEDDT